MVEEKKKLEGHWGVSYPIDSFYEKVRDAAKQQNVDIRTFVKEAIVEKMRSVETKKVITD